MRKPFTDDGPNQPLSLIIDCDDPFANRDSIGEGYNSGAGFELCVNNKTWHHPGVQSANVLDRRPDLIRVCCGCNLFSYSSHTPSLQMPRTVETFVPRQDHFRGLSSQRRINAIRPVLWGRFPSIVKPLIPQF